MDEFDGTAQRRPQGRGLRLAVAAGRTPRRGTSIAELRHLDPGARTPHDVRSPAGSSCSAAVRWPSARCRCSSVISGSRRRRSRSSTSLDNRDRIAAALALGVRYEIDRVTPENLDEFLSARVGDGDLLLDLAWNIDNPTILQWCRDHGVRYLNTSVEVWDPYDDLERTQPLDRTLYVRHMELRRMKAVVARQPGRHRGRRARRQPRSGQPLRQAGALRDRRRRCCATASPTTRPRSRRARAARRRRHRFNELAMLTGTKVIHIAERDTQITDRPKRAERVRQHVVRRRLLRGGHRARPRWAGARTSGGCRRTRTCTPARGRATRSASRSRAWRPGCAAGCRAARSAAWSCATARRSRCAST